MEMSSGNVFSEFERLEINEYELTNYEKKRQY